MRIDIPHDENLIADIAARFDLREPNRQALTDLVAWLASGDTDTDNEGVADLATGVGKTYLMSALIEYLAHCGVRNVLIVTPGSTIQRKTIDNFDEASRKYVPGADLIPTIVTPDNFQTAQTGSLLHDRTALKVLVFNVQQLLAPTAEASRRTREVDENIGAPLYQHLQNADDLFVIADEHHLYSTRARAFNSAIRDLDPVALIGLTATPAPENFSKIKSRYTLGQAIADGFVKTPVIVYRRDGTTDERTQLRDACALLRIKEQAYNAYQSAAPSAAPVKPVLFVVCSSIDHAETVAATLAQADFIGDGHAVLQVTSQSSDEALQALADVENADSPIRAIVSVNMLKEGWDVKNIAVIVALRTLASQALTEQILGRGLRLPYGVRTGIPTIDQVDLVAHDSYAQLLQQRDVLVQRLQATSPTPPAVDQHGAATETPPSEGGRGAAEGPGSEPEDLPGNRDSTNDSIDDEQHGGHGLDIPTRTATPWSTSKRPRPGQTHNLPASSNEVSERLSSPSHAVSPSSPTSTSPSPTSPPAQPKSPDATSPATPPPSSSETHSKPSTSATTSASLSGPRRTQKRPRSTSSSPAYATTSPKQSCANPKSPAPENPSMGVDASLTPSSAAPGSPPTTTQPNGPNGGVKAL